jgi:hypothetical protein
MFHVFNLLVDGCWSIGEHAASTSADMNNNNNNNTAARMFIIIKIFKNQMLYLLNIEVQYIIYLINKAMYTQLAYKLLLVKASPAVDKRRKEKNFDK